jgi:hypothetical protein
MGRAQAAARLWAFTALPQRRRTPAGAAPWTVLIGRPESIPRLSGGQIFAFYGCVKNTNWGMASGNIINFLQKIIIHVPYNGL